MSNHSPEASSGSPLISEFADDPDMIELVEMFVDEMPQRVSAIERAAQQADLATIAGLAHQLKGAAGGYGFGTITDAAAVLEQQAQASEKIDEVHASIDALLSLCRRAVVGPNA